MKTCDLVSIHFDTVRPRSLQSSPTMRTASSTAAATTRNPCAFRCQPPACLFDAVHSAGPSALAVPAARPHPGKSAIAIFSCAACSRWHSTSFRRNSFVTTGCATTGKLDCHITCSPLFASACRSAMSLENRVAQSNAEPRAVTRASSRGRSPPAWHSEARSRGRPPA